MASCFSGRTVEGFWSFRNFEDENVERDVDRGGQAWEASDENENTKGGCLIFLIKNLWNGNLLFFTGKIDAY